MNLPANENYWYELWPIDHVWSRMFTNGMHISGEEEKNQLLYSSTVHIQSLTRNSILSILINTYFKPTYIISLLPSLVSDCLSIHCTMKKLGILDKYQFHSQTAEVSIVLFIYFFKTHTNWYILSDKEMKITF